MAKKSEKEPNPYFNNKQSHFAQKEPLIRFYKQPNAHHKLKNQNISANCKFQKYRPTFLMRMAHFESNNFSANFLSNYDDFNFWKLSDAQMQKFLSGQNDGK